MKRRLLTIALVIIFALNVTTTALAQNYSFSLDKEVVNVFWNLEGTMSLDYLFTFSNQRDELTLDCLDICLPNNSYVDNKISVDVECDALGISSDYEGSGSW